MMNTTALYTSLAPAMTAPITEWGVETWLFASHWAEIVGNTETDFLRSLIARG